MATNLHNVVRNFRWRLESLAPHTSTTSKKFHHIDPLRIDPSSATGLERGFSVTWVGAGGEVYPTDMYARDADHEIEVAVYYPVGDDGYSLEAVMDLICRDRHDIAKALRDPDNHKGYSDTQAATDIGLQNRVLSTSVLERDETLWTLLLTYTCFVREVEQ